MTTTPSGAPGASPLPGPTAADRCPNCSAPHAADALFCEECAFDFTGGRATTALASGPAAQRSAPVDPVTAEVGSESPLDVGWTGPVSRQVEPLLPPPPAEEAGAPCTECDEGHYADGYCDNCGSKQRDPRDHFEEEPAPWVAGVCDIGLRHTRNEDAMSLHADPAQLSFAVLVVCDGVSNSTDSHIASLAASRAARDVLDDPVARGMGTRAAIVASMAARLDDAVQAARRAVVATTADREVENPPSCTFVAAVIDDGLAVVGNVGDSRAYWLPDDPTAPARQLSRDDSFADEQMAAGMSREEAETSPGAHAITRWLGLDSPDDLTPHTADLDLVDDGWLMVCSDGLWNYCSDATDLQHLVHDTMGRLGAAARHPGTLAQALTDYALERGGMDNITVTLARVGVVDAKPEPPAPGLPGTTPGTDPEPTPGSAPSAGLPTSDGVEWGDAPATPAAGATPAVPPTADPDTTPTVDQSTTFEAATGSVAPDDGKDTP
ncbi:MAG: PP2C family protein-serine/threonine phosphatase [Lapillicoccus sp.]